MNIENVVLIRAMNNLPEGKELLPSCEGKYIKLDDASDYYYEMKKIVQKHLENSLGRSLDLYYGSDDLNLLKEQLDKYITYTSSYTSTLSFSLNGLAPDDINNNFTTMKIAIIDPIKYHMDDDYVNVDAIDTTIKGRINMSSEAILVIENNYFNSLDNETKANLSSNYKIELYTGTLRSIIPDILNKYNYPSLHLIQNREQKDIIDCEEKQSMIEFQDKFAQSTKASRLKLQRLYFDPFFYTEEDQLAAQKVKTDFEKNLIIEKHYKDNLYNFLIIKAENFGIVLTDEEKFYIFSDYKDGVIILNKLLSNLIMACEGIEKFQLLISEYNNNVLNNYLTNDEIIKQETNNMQKS